VKQAKGNVMKLLARRGPAPAPDVPVDNETFAAPRRCRADSTGQETRYFALAVGRSNTHHHFVRSCLRAYGRRRTVR
jgi:hypothetical protein